VSRARPVQPFLAQAIAVYPGRRVGKVLRLCNLDSNLDKISQCKIYRFCLSGEVKYKDKATQLEKF
jgi:hypothetical protein